VTILRYWLCAVALMGVAVLLAVTDGAALSYVVGGVAVWANLWVWGMLLFQRDHFTEGLLARVEFERQRLDAKWAREHARCKGGR